jgi:hypothetical protein
MTSPLQKREAACRPQPPHPVTPDGGYFVVRGKLWRMADPDLTPAKASALISELMKARSAVRSAKLAGSLIEEAAAHRAVDLVKRETRRARSGVVEGRSARSQSARGEEHLLCEMVFRLAGEAPPRGMCVSSGQSRLSQWSVAT